VLTKRNAARAAVGAFALFACVAGCGSSWAQQVDYNYDRNVDFSKFKTYKWVEIKGGEHPNQLQNQDIREAINEQLAGKLTMKDEDPVDLYVGYQVSVQHEKELNGYGGGLGWRLGGGMMDATVSTIDVGTIVVDFYEPDSKTLVWRGSATNSLPTSGNPDKKMKHLNKAMGKLLMHFPPPADKDK
jgi:hypothetical protein